MSNTAQQDQYYTDVQIAAMLGRNPVTVRKWRGKNKVEGCIKYGPPYEYRGPNVVYPKAGFVSWCKQVRFINGVPSMDAPITANIPLPVAKPVDPRQMSLIDEGTGGA